MRHSLGASAGGNYRKHFVFSLVHGRLGSFVLGFLEKREQIDGWHIFAQDKPSDDNKKEHGGEIEENASQPLAYACLDYHDEKKQASNKGVYPKRIGEVPFAVGKIITGQTCQGVSC